MNSYFDFKRFRICHDRCAMKVSTDAVLLGSWARVEGARKILDIGCGSGIIALMAAQRVQEAMVVGIDIEEEAAIQAQENGQASPFSDRVSFKCVDVRDFCDEDKFDAILCNPPFYTEDTMPPDEKRSTARNTHSLSFEELVGQVGRLIRDGGVFHVIIPTKAEEAFTGICSREGLFPFRICHVKSTASKPFKRTLCSYSTIQPLTIEKEELVLMENGCRSKAFEQLTSDFYLDRPLPS